jgi:hypothetical protein
VGRSSVWCALAQFGSGVAQLVRRSSVGCGVVQFGCGVAQLVVRRLAVRQARVRLLARHPMVVILLLSEEARRIQEDRPRRMVKEE